MNPADPIPVHRANDRTTLLTPYFILRTSGLPLHHIDSLSLKKTAKLHTSAFNVTKRIHSLSEEIVEALHSAVSHPTLDKLQRRVLLKAKRDAHNRRIPTNVDAIRQAISGIDNSTKKPIHEWFDLIGRWERRITETEAEYHRELELCRKKLKELLSQPPFSNGIVTASPVFSKNLIKYLQEQGAPTRRKSRLAERTAVRYLTRYTCRTIPFGKLATVALGNFSTVPTAMDQDLIRIKTDLHTRSAARLNISVLSRLTSAILRSVPETVEDIPIMLRDGYQYTNYTLSYNRRTISFRDLQGSSLAIDSTVREFQFRLPGRQVLHYLLRTLQQDRDWSAQALVDHLITKYRTTSTDVIYFIQALIRLDILTIPNLRQSPFVEDPLTSYIQSLETIPNVDIRQIRHSLSTVSSLVGQYPLACDRTRRDLQDRVQSRLRHCFDSLNRDRDSLPNNLIYEDTLMDTSDLVIPVSQWSEVFDDLAHLQQVLPIFDRSIDDRLTVHAFLDRALGSLAESDDLIGLASRFDYEVVSVVRRFDQMARRDSGSDSGNSEVTNIFGIPEINTLRYLRSQFYDHLHSTNACQPDHSRVDIDPVIVDRIAQSMPPNLVSIYSYSFFVQLIQRGSSPRILLKGLFDGLTHMFSRFMYLFDGTDDRQIHRTFSSMLRELLAGDCVLAEIQGGIDTNMNLRRRMVDYEILMPGEYSDAPRQFQIAIGDLYLGRSGTSSKIELRSRRLNKRVIPLYLGFALPQTLPALQRFLLQFSPHAFPDFDIQSTLLQRSLANGSDLDKIPRVCFRNLVLSPGATRISSVHYDEFCRSSTSEFDRFCQAESWRRSLGLPVTTFVRPLTRSDSSRNMSSAPMYFDFRSPFMLPVLDSLVSQQSESLVFEEAITRDGTLNLGHNEEAFVGEIMIELHSIGSKSNG